jgi:hypothetical protein
MRKKVGAALPSSTRLIRPACLSGLRVSRHLASRTLSPFSAFASPVEERAWRLRAYWKVRRMTHSNFPIWSKLLIIASARARFAPGGRRSVLVPSARGRTTSSMGIVEVTMTGVRSQRGMKRDSTPHHVCRSYGSFQGRPLHVLRNRTELVPRSMSLNRDIASTVRRSVDEGVSAPIATIACERQQHRGRCRHIDVFRGQNESRSVQCWGCCG